MERSGDKAAMSSRHHAGLCRRAREVCFGRGKPRPALAELRANPHASRRLTVPAGHVIFKEGDDGDGMYLVDDGRVEISATGIGTDSRILTHLEAGAFFGEIAVLDDRPHSATAAAVVESVLHFIPRDEARRRTGSRLRVRSILLRRRSFDLPGRSILLRRRSFDLPGRSFLLRRRSFYLRRRSFEVGGGASEVGSPYSVASLWSRLRSRRRE